MTQFSHAIITGGSSGIGKETARLLVRRGSKVTLMARRPELLAAAKAELARERGDAHASVMTIAVDVSDRPAITDAIAQSERQMGPCDLLVTSAGIVEPGHFQDIPIDAFERTMSVNYFGTLYAIRAVAPRMRERRRGHIVLLSSGAGLVGVFGYSAYSPSKFALRGLAEVLRAELAADGIGVSIVYPPDTDTPQLAAESLIRPAETTAITAGARVWNADDLAESIIKGIDARKFVIAPGWEMTWLYRLHSLAAPLIAWHFDGVVARVRKRSRSPEP
jgi:3-dehydrosphinganine reductase